MAKEQFFHSETPALFKKLEELSRRSGVSRGHAFEDWLTAMVCALAAETKEAEYLSMVDRHKSGKPGKRGVDLMSQMFGELVSAMDTLDADILGDLFQGAITHGEAGQYFSPESLARLLAEMTVDPEARGTADKPLLINDPCCGTGRMLLEAAKVNPHLELVGQDIDHRCAKITAINMGLRGRYGWVICGNSLSGETRFAYRIGSFFHESPNGLRRGLIRDVPVEQTPVPVISERARRKTRELFVNEETIATKISQTKLHVIEVPPWLARLEPQFAAVERESLEPPAEAAEHPKLSPEPESHPRKQQTLF